MRIAYSEASLGGADENQLAVHRWNGQEWVPLVNGAADADANTVSGETSQFSPFAVIEIVPNPLPTLGFLDPETVVEGGPAFTLTVSGTGFVESSEVRWDGEARATTFQSATMLTAQIAAADIAAAGDAAVTVFSPTPGGGTTAPLAFPILPLQTTFIVTTTADEGAGSLRQAILDANADPGADLIHFDIPGAGPHTIQPTSALPTVTDPVVIDGYTQPGSSPNTNPTGAINAVLRIELDGDQLPDAVSGLTITAGGSTVRGLVINRSGGDGIRLAGGGDNVIEGNFFGTDVAGAEARGNSGSGIRGIDSPDNRIGGTTAAARNLISGNDFHGVDLGGGGSTGNRVEGNLIGTDPTGMAPLVNHAAGVIIEDDATGNVIGGTVPAARNVISGNEGAGVRVDDGGAANRIEGNFIGTDATGAAGLGNGADGVFIGNTPGTIIGGTAPGAGNVISANGDDGVDFSGAEGTVAQGNVIGTDPGGTIDLGNGDAGMNLFNSTDNQIGGTQAGAGNVIAFNRNVVFSDRAGIRVAGASTGNAILGNSLYENVGLGIDLAGDGVTANDPGDGDEGTNRVQNFPDLVSAIDDGEQPLTVTYSVDTDPANAAYPLRVEFFLADADGEEGRTFLGADSYPEASAQTERQAVLMPAVEVSEGALILATATDADGNTSEFSAAVPVGGAPTPTTFIVTTTADGGAGSLRQAILDANANPGADLIHFDINGIVLYTIMPLSALPAITDPVTIDGLTQPGADCSTWPATLRIELDGSSAGGGANGLTLSGGGPTVRGLVINRFDGAAGMAVDSNENAVECNYLGTDATGTLQPGGPFGHNDNGVLIDGGDDNVIGGATPSKRNLIASSGDDGVVLDGGATGNVIAGNFIGTDVHGAVALENGDAGVLIVDAADNTIGGADHAAGVCDNSCNLISGSGTFAGIRIDPNDSDSADGTVIQGNFIGTDLTGTVAIPNGDSGIDILASGSSDDVEGLVIGGATDPGVCSAACNLISGNDEHGIFDNDSDGAVIQGNFIGTDATGTAALPNGQDGIDSNGDGTVIGNLISGNGDAGIDLGGDNTVIRGNLIGVATDGTTPLGNGEEGISLDGSNNLVGGTTSDEANVIAYNGEFGIFAGGTTSAGNLFNGNAIFANGDLGINLCLVEVFVCDGVTPNDAGDADEGPNGLQNFPELSAATLNGTLSVTGTLNSTPSTTFRVEFFANDALDASGHGEGQTYLGFADVTTDASGDAAIAAVLGSAGVAAGDFITATATDPDGNTSEFSAGVEVQ